VSAHAVASRAFAYDTGARPAGDALERVEVSITRRAWLDLQHNAAREPFQLIWAEVSRDGDELCLALRPILILK